MEHELEIIGMQSDKPLTLREVKRAFRRKSHILLPEKALGAQNAHSRFEDLNAAFLRILYYLRDNGDDISDLLPSEPDVKKAMFVIKLKKGTVPFWRRVIKTVYPTVIIGAQKKVNFVPGAQGKGIRFVVYWKGSGAQEGSLQQVKVNLVLYENELLQVSGSGYFLWTMDNFTDLSRRVDDIMNDAQRSEDEGCITEDFSDSRGSSETKVTVEDVKCAVVRCQEPSCQASKKFETILKYLEDIDEDLSTKCSDLKSYIQSLETGFTKQLEGLSRTLEENEQRYSEDYTNTQEKIVAINEKVVETRQIIGGTSGGSKVSKVVSEKVGVEKVKQKLSTSPKKSEAGGRKGKGEKDGKSKSTSRSSSPRKKESNVNNNDRKSRSRSVSPRKENSKLLEPNGQISRSRSRKSSSKRVSNDEEESFNGYNNASRSHSRKSSVRRRTDLKEDFNDERNDSFSNGKANDNFEDEDNEEEEEFDEDTNGSSVSLDV